MKSLSDEKTFAIIFTVPLNTLGKQMELSKLERLNLINQFFILEKLYPEDANYYATHRKAIQEGYKLH